MKFTNGIEQIEATQFKPKDIWPEPIVKWDKYVPRDMSWGYVLTDRGKVHVLGGDWIIKKENGNWDVCRPDVFEQNYKAVNEAKEYPTNRRARLDLIEPSEKAIYDAVAEVEKVGADVRLTKSIILLQQARDQLADYFDEKLGVRK